MASWAGVVALSKCSSASAEKRAGTQSDQLRSRGSAFWMVRSWSWTRGLRSQVFTASRLHPAPKATQCGPSAWVAGLRSRRNSA
jgi:hypothetical protein